MSIRPVELREFFHLSFLRHLSPKLSGRAYAVKGGICLRLFHRSPRLSMDMDLDITPGVNLDKLKKTVDAIVDNRSFLASLVPQGITSIDVTKPKQTETTQRWKAALHAGGNEPLRTKIEFSRRRTRVQYSQGIPDPELLERYRIAPFAVQFYDSARMVEQKITALSSASRHAVRDVFDLHHLFFTVGVKPEDLAGRDKAEDIERAADKVARFSFQEFREQVFPFLSETVMALYQGPKAFEKLKDEVEQALMRMMRMIP